MTPQRPWILLEGPYADLHRDRYGMIDWFSPWSECFSDFFGLLFFACLIHK